MTSTFEALFVETCANLGGRSFSRRLVAGGDATGVITVADVQGAAMSDLPSGVTNYTASSFTGTRLGGYGELPAKGRPTPVAQTLGLEDRRDALDTGLRQPCVIGSFAAGLFDGW